MISEDAIKQISLVFCGDTEEIYEYKSGPKLVEFVNRYFHKKDVYAQGFPSRWMYVYNNIVELLNSGKIDSFFNIILSKSYILSERKQGDVDAIKVSTKAFACFNKILSPYEYKLLKNGETYKLIKSDSDLEFLDQGGFANVYLSKSTGLIVKKLKEDYLSDSAIRSRFKREYSITKSLSDIDNVICVYDYVEMDAYYTMERAEKNLEDYVKSGISEEQKIICIRQILSVMKLVHKRDIIHRDISPNNIFVINGKLKIADFGLGKDLNIFTSHQTIHTNSFGQYYYCAPEQFMLLKDGDKRSDVYSLGKLINFIMTNHPNNNHHFLRSVTEKATSESTNVRYADAGQLLYFVEKCIEYHNTEISVEKLNNKIHNKTFDEEIEAYIYEMNSDTLCKNILNGMNNFGFSLITFMRIDERHALHIMQSIEQNYTDVCNRFEDYDNFAYFSNSVLKGKFSYVVNEIAANILRYIAYDVNRFSAQHLIDALIEDGIEPMLEDILKS